MTDFITSFQTEEKLTPDDIECKSQIFDVNFHPHAPYIAVGLVDGEVDIFKYGFETDENVLMAESRHHSSSCRGVLFNNAGDQLYTISSDKSLVTLDANGKIASTISNAHTKPINKMVLCDENMLSTADDSGCVKVWDMRQASLNGQQPVKSFHLHEDFVSDMIYNMTTHTLISVSGDMTLCAYDLRNCHNNSKEKAQRSDEQESELNCVALIKNGRKVVTGTQDGTVLTFSFGKWGDCTDRYPGEHPDVLDSMLRLDDNTILTGCSDGLIRVVQIQPNAVLGVVGDHDGFPVEGMRRNGPSGNILASHSHDEIVHFWDISVFCGANPNGNAGADMTDDDTDLDTDVAFNDNPSGIRSRPSNRAMPLDDVSEGDEDEVEMEAHSNSDSDSDSSAMNSDSNGDAMDEDSDSDSDSDGGMKGMNRNIAAQRRMPTATEQFYSDL